MSNKNNFTSLNINPLMARTTQVSPFTEEGDHQKRRDHQNTQGTHRCPLSPEEGDHFTYFKKGSSKIFPMSVAPMSLS